MDIALTATLRPEIILQTLDSFQNNLLITNKHRLIVNIDPVGDENYSQYDVLTILKTKFPNIVVNMPITGNFSMAVKWTWEQIKSDCFLNLEDDWLLMVPLDLQAILNVFKHNERLAVLRFPTGSTTKDRCCVSRKARQAICKWNGQYYETDLLQKRALGFVGAPSIIRKEWAKKFLNFIVPNCSPEGHFKRMQRKNIEGIRDWKYGAWSVPDTKKTVVDIGTVWRRERGIFKDCHNFRTWVKHGK